MKTPSFVNCIAFVSVIINVGGGFFVDAKLVTAPVGGECSFTTKGKCLKVKNKTFNTKKGKFGKKCAWRLIEGTRLCVNRLSCSGISTEVLCNKKKKKRACSWKKETIHLDRNLRTKGGTCVTEETKSQWDPCPQEGGAAQHFCSSQSSGAWDWKQCTDGCLLCKGLVPNYPEFIECHDDLSVAECSSESGMFCHDF